MAENTSSSVQVIDRAFMVLEVISKNGTMSFKDIYTKLNLNKASALRIVRSLVENNYIKKDDNTGTYSLTFKAFEVGVSAVRNVDYISLIKSILEKLSTEFNVIAQFSVEDNNEILCLESYDPSQSNFSVFTRVGQRSTLYATSAGKAILSTYSNEELREKWPKMNVHSFTKNTITNFEDLLSDIQVIRQRNYALDNEESEPRLFCVGTVLLNYNRKPIGAISLSADHTSTEFRQQLSEALLKETSQLSYMLGYSMH